MGAPTVKRDAFCSACGHLLSEHLMQVDDPAECFRCRESQCSCSLEAPWKNKSVRREVLRP